jgi:hypothetical protein
MTTDPYGEPTTWTLGAIKARGLKLEGQCVAPGCGWFARFDLDSLIEAAGPDYVMPELIPDVPCELCGGRLKFVLAMLHEGSHDDGGSAG